VLECEDLPEFEDGVIEEVVLEDEDGSAAFPGLGPGLGPRLDELELGPAAPSSPLERERERDESETCL